uniref:Uncharacterized protein n=1 Tax=Rhizophora mucronata TaxID=61149 RepID=A0A2P2R3T3_RHIMU
MNHTQVITATRWPCKMKQQIFALEGSKIWVKWRIHFLNIWLINCD